MSPILTDHSIPTSAAPRRKVFATRTVSAVAGGLTVGLGVAGHALAQAASPSGGLGEQINKMSGEALNAGSTTFSSACYLAAALCFFFGVWAAWQSRQPQNRETGYVGRALAGLALCGLFATSGVWIGKAAFSASGGSATIGTTPGMVTFGSAAGASAP